MKDENGIEIKMRYRCSNCKNLESHHLSNKKRKCKKCGESLKEISEKDYQHYKHKLKKEYEEDKKETSYKNKEKEKEKKKHSDKTEEESQKESVKPKHKLKKNLSTKNLEDKNYKSKKENEIKITNKPKKDDSNKQDKKKKNRHNSMEKIGSIVSNIVSNLFDQNQLGDSLNKLDELDLSDLEGTTIFVNHSNNNTKVVVNNKEVNTDIFDPIFNQFGSIFNDNFVNNFMQNFSSSNGDNYYEEVQNIVNDNQQYGIENNVEPVQEDILSKLKKFKLTKKYCKKDKKGKLELPNCCICLSEIEIGKDAMLLPCGHLFHYKCCFNWLKNNNTCPMCRFEIK